MINSKLKGSPSAPTKLPQVPSDMKLLEELISFLYLNFIDADGKQKTRIVKLLIEVLDLKWKYLGLDRSESKIDVERLKEALQKAGVRTSEDTIKYYMEQLNGKNTVDESEEEEEEEEETESGEEEVEEEDT